MPSARLGAIFLSFAELFGCQTIHQSQLLLHTTMISYQSSYQSPTKFWNLLTPLISTVISCQLFYRSLVELKHSLLFLMTIFPWCVQVESKCCLKEFNKWIIKPRLNKFSHFYNDNSLSVCVNHHKAMRIQSFIAFPKLSSSCWTFQVFNPLASISLSFLFKVQMLRVYDSI